MRREFISELSIKPMTPLTEGTKSNVNPAPQTPRPDFTPAGQGVPIHDNGAQPPASSQPQSDIIQVSHEE